MLKKFLTLTTPQQRFAGVGQHDHELPSFPIDIEDSSNKEAEFNYESNDPHTLLMNAQYPRQPNFGNGIAFDYRFPSTTQDYYMSPQEGIYDSKSIRSRDVVKCITVKQSHHLPPWMWKIIALILGIPLKPNSKPWCATLLHVFTFASAIMFFISNTWFIVYDIASLHTKQDVLNGTVTIIVCMFWGMLAIYANKLAYRMFKHRSFVKNIRLHSKTILKFNAAMLIISCGLAFTLLNNISAVSVIDEKTCKTVDLELVVCKIAFISRISFSVFAYLWNTLIALVLISVCRTHTIGIRRFIRDLEKDAIAYDQYHFQIYRGKVGPSFNIFQEYIWIDEDDFSQLSYTEDLEEESDSEVNCSNKTVRSVPYKTLTSQTSESQEQTNSQSTDQNGKMSDYSTSTKMNEHKLHSDTSVPDMSLISEETESKDATTVHENFNIESPLISSSPTEKSTTTPCLLTNEEILHRYWKIQCHIRMSSGALQRWMVCFVCMCLLWVGIYLAYWLSHSPSALDVAQFIIPLIMLPVLCSAYAEVNNEGQRMLRFLCPSERRLWMLFYLNEAPLQMMIYGFPIKYSTVVTSLFGLVAALASGIILQEIKSL